MATTIRMPEVLANVTEAAVQKWLVAEGDTIEVGQPFAEIETEKAVVEYTAETAGTVLQLLIGEGDAVDVGAPIALVGEAGEVAPASPAADPSAASAGGSVVVAPSDAAATPAAVAPAPAPAAPAPAAAPAADAASVAPAADGRRFISPLVRRLAREHGLDLASVRGSGPEGRIVRRDIEALLAGAPAAATTAAAPAATPPAAAPAPAAVPTAPAGLEPELIPASRMRKTIARRLTESKSTVPHFYLTAECRVDRLLELRRELNAIDGVKVSVNDLVVKAVAAAFVDVPEANTTWTDEGMLRHRTVDIAIAVSLDDGLVTPVVRGVERLSVSALSAAIVDLATRARSGGLKQHEIEGGSFAVSNLGMFGTQEFSAIINPPQAGILAVGAARQAPVVVDGALAVGTVMSVTLSADHRVLDGALAARWLAAFVARIENPVSILA
ncbi:dihydrolipoamide acetyltransferase family protein [Microcella frigidaquae]|uniref:Dihydrolipoamide acetyltransferase component of pyruvate dehydrogenase complex n=3 Tax=Microcella frigidaquae TaxID=424758 RepID=A0A840XIY2_9MICO|nr:dihydrolipoamide acetyltransferase family protein [Microcella frigidaquae]MBB5618432.1 pyruvate dehydrogenase E2 component (dihydrolipoamide acetyltransferase) [Microcella frigidaquae]